MEREAGCILAGAGPSGKDPLWKALLISPTRTWGSLVPTRPPYELRVIGPESTPINVDKPTSRSWSDAPSRTAHFGQCTSCRLHDRVHPSRVGDEQLQ